MILYPNPLGVLSKHFLFAIGIAVLVSTTAGTFADEPRVQSLVPGVHITRLPISLTNIDSVEYGPDGRLYAAGYDGRVHVLTDSDGDGMEDHADIFWDKSGDLLTPVGILPTAEGVYVAARGKIALLKDTDGDGLADKSEVVVSGWNKEQHNSDTRNDAAGLAIDQQGNLYFSLGCMSYNKAWLLDADDKSQYDIASERGTILKVSPDRKQREIIATGLRFVIGLDFNKQGDLFATDQEGDTWFPGGNPRDELLHIIPGRHYGFPFRHPKYLPDVIDEPEVVGFSPQHQSTCGFRINETRSGRKQFGPAHWDGNAIVTGFSRGKLWRVPLTKTRAGYVGKQIQFAAFESLPTDVAVSPSGDLLVTCHSGKPDWGAGPGATGHLYKITFDRAMPQPVVVWPASPLEIKIAFDRPLDPTQLDSAEIEMGAFVWEGNRQEWIWPGYEVVEAERRAIRHPLNFNASQLSADGRTVTITTAGQPWRARYAVRLLGVAAKQDSADATKVTDANPNSTTIEMSFDLGGTQAEWTRKGEQKPAWTGWLPHVDMDVVRTLTTGSAEHERLMELLKEPGQLRMRSQLLLPGNSVVLRFESQSRFKVFCGKSTKTSESKNEKHVVEMNVSASEQAQTQLVKTRGDRQQVLPTEIMPLEIEAETGISRGDFVIDVSYHADFDPHERPLRLEHLFVPWAPTMQPPTADENETDSPLEIVGDPAKGREIFFGTIANCAACHTYGGQGGTVAADLTVSAHRSAAAVMQDIIEPNAAINPDYVSYMVETISGRTLVGLLQAADEKQITLVDGETKTHQINRDEIVDLQASPLSLMPTGFEKLGKENLQDLVAFLCTEDVEAKRKGLPTGVILREYWLDLPDKGIKSLTQHADFPGKPAGTGLLTQFEGPVNWKESYGARIRGYVHPPQTGEYTFWVAADDHAELWLSTSAVPAEKVRIVAMNRWTPSRVWEKYPEQKSKPIRLEAGKRYYIEALQIEATVDDCLAVGWQLPDGTMERPIPGNRLSTADVVSE
jgi:putative heme-binding domain-containing protein